MMEQDTVLKGIVQACTRLLSETEFKKSIPIFVEQSADYSHSDLAGLYLYKDFITENSPMALVHRYGMLEVPEVLPGRSVLAQFLKECEKTVVLLKRRESPFLDILLNDEMNSGIALPLHDGKHRLGALFFNSCKEYHYGNNSLRYLDALTQLAGGLLKNPMYNVTGIN